MVLDIIFLLTLFTAHPPFFLFLTNPVSTPNLPLFLSSSPQWCERNEQCRRLQLRDLLVAPLQRLTRYPLLLRNIAKRFQTEEETRGLQAVAEQVDTSICEQHTHRFPVNYFDLNEKNKTHNLKRPIFPQKYDVMMLSTTFLTSTLLSLIKCLLLRGELCDFKHFTRILSAADDKLNFLFCFM